MGDYTIIYCSKLRYDARHQGKDELEALAYAELRNHWGTPENCPLPDVEPGGEALEKMLDLVRQESTNGGFRVVADPGDPPLLVGIDKGGESETVELSSISERINENGKPVYSWNVLRKEIDTEGGA